MSLDQPSESTSSITDDKRPLPPKLDDPAADEELFKEEPMVEAPVKADYGFNVRLGQGVFVNFNAVFIDTCPITVGARTMFGPNVSLFSGTHPLDPALRNGIKGPETGSPIVIGEDCWLGGNVIVLPGVTIGKGATVGAGSVVTKVCLCRGSSMVLYGISRSWQFRWIANSIYRTCRLSMWLLATQQGLSARLKRP